MLLTSFDPNSDASQIEGETIKTRVHVVIGGRVQGVFFRAATKREAESLGVKGFVRNLPDDKVEAVFEGEADVVNRLIDFVKHGPSGARVSNIAIAWEPFKAEYKDFNIKF